MVISKTPNKTIFFAAVIALVALDQVAKAAVRNFLQPSASITIFGPIQLTNWANTGSVFGLFPGTSGYIAAFSLLVIPAVMLLCFSGFLRQRLAATLLVAGLAGNTIDRLSMGFVTDFIRIGPWPAFNLADTFLTIGILLLAASLLLPSITLVFRKHNKDL